MSPRVLSVKSHLGVLCGLWELGPFELLNLCLTPSLALFAHCVLLRLQAKIMGSTGVMARPGSGLPRLDSPHSARPHTLRGPLESHSPFCVCDLAQNKDFEKYQISQPAGPPNPRGRMLGFLRRMLPTPASRHLKLGEGVPPNPWLPHSEALKPQLKLSRKEPCNILSRWGLSGRRGGAWRGDWQRAVGSWPSPRGSGVGHGFCRVPLFAP